MPPPRRTNNFQVEWMRKKKLCTWLTSVRNSSDRAHCKLCKKNFDVGNMGICAVNSHMQSAKHRRISQKQQGMAATQNTLIVTVMRASSANADVLQAMTASSSVTPSTSVVPADPTVVSTVGTKKDDILCTQRWCYEGRDSLGSEDRNGKLLVQFFCWIERTTASHVTGQWDCQEVSAHFH